MASLGGGPHFLQAKDALPLLEEGAGYMVGLLLGQDTHPQASPGGEERGETEVSPISLGALVCGCPLSFRLLPPQGSGPKHL